MFADRCRRRPGGGRPPGLRLGVSRRCTTRCRLTHQTKLLLLGGGFLRRFLGGSFLRGRFLRGSFLRYRFLRGDFLRSRFLLRNFLRSGHLLSPFVQHLTTTLSSGLTHDDRSRPSERFPRHCRGSLTSCGRTPAKDHGIVPRFLGYRRNRAGSDFSSSTHAPKIFFAFCARDDQKNRVFTRSHAVGSGSSPSAREIDFSQYLQAYS